MGSVYIPSEDPRVRSWGGAEGLFCSWFPVLHVLVPEDQFQGIDRYFSFGGRGLMGSVYYTRKSCLVKDTD